MSPGAFSSRYAFLGRVLVLLGWTMLAIAGAALLVMALAFSAALFGTAPSASGVGSLGSGAVATLIPAALAVSWTFPSLFVLGGFGAAAAGYGYTLLERSARP